MFVGILFLWFGVFPVFYLITHAREIYELNRWTAKCTQKLPDGVSAQMATTTIFDCPEVSPYLAARGFRNN